MIDEIKEHQRLAQRPLVSKSLLGLWQEFYALLLAHYALRHLMAQAAEQQGLDADRLSFTHSIDLLDFRLSAGTDPLDRATAASGPATGARAGSTRLAAASSPSTVQFPRHQASSLTVSV